MSGENLNGKLIRALQQNNRNEQRTLPDNTISYSTRQFHRVRSYDNMPTPTDQQQKTYSDFTSKYIVPHGSKTTRR